MAVYENRPLVFMTAQGRPKGIFIDVLEHIASQEGFHLEYIAGTWSESLERLSSGQCDVLVAIAFTKWRARKYAFTKEAVLSNWGRIITRPGIRIESFQDLKGRTVAVPRDDIYFTRLIQLLNDFGIICNYVMCEGYRDVIRAVASRQAEAGVTSRFAKPSPEQAPFVVGTPVVFAPIELKFAFPKTTAASIIRAFDRRLEQLKADQGSVYYKSLDRWLGGGAGSASGNGYVRLLAEHWPLLLLVMVLVVVVLTSRHKRGERRKAERRSAMGRREQDRFAALQQEALRFMAESAGDSLVVVDPDGWIIEDSSGYIYEMFGYVPQSAKGMDFTSLFAGNEDGVSLEAEQGEGRVGFDSGDPDLWLQVLDSAGRPGLFRFTARRLSGRTFSAEACCRLVERDGARRMVCVIRDLGTGA